MSIQPTYRLPANLSDDIDKFAQLARDYRKGTVGATEFKAFRVPFGVYEQRQNDVYMARVRCTGGLIRPAQLREIIAIAQRHHSSLLHITTRGEIQLQNLALDDVEPVERELQQAHLATKGGGGNTVRNIIVAELSGIATDEAWDPTPYAVALTSKVVPEPDSYLMPRKLKVAFQNNGSILDFAAINDIGLVATIKDGKQGFEVYVGGGMGGKPATGHLLYSFFPAEDLYSLVSAVRRYFSRTGNRKNRHKARLRFVFYKKGVEQTLREIDEVVKEELAKGVKLEPADLGEERPHVDYTAPESALRLTQHLSEQYATWRSRYVTPQKQAGYVSVYLPVFLGNIAVEPQRVQHLDALLRFVERFGDNTLRFTTGQGIRLRNIPEAAVPELWTLLRWFSDETDQPVITSRLQSCTGADTCRLGLALSKNLAREVRKALLASSLDLDLLANTTIHITGCPNSCGQQVWSDLGFAGNPLRKDGRSLPGYKVFLQADKGRQPHLGEAIGVINARDLPRFVVEVLGAYQQKAKEQTFHDYLASPSGRAVVEYILEKYQDIPSFEADKNYYFDWGAEELFSVAPGGQAECSAGLFDMISVDSDNIAGARRQLEQAQDDVEREKALHGIVYYASRMLLVTRGLDPKTPQEVYTLFIEHFLTKGYLPHDFTPLIELVRDDENAPLLQRKDEVLLLGELLPKLYATMNDALEFTPITTDVASDSAITADAIQDNPQQAPATAGEAGQATLKDFRGVACPMNFVKTKLALASLNSGDLLEIWLDDGQPINNVPGSVKLEGHAIVEQQQTKEGYWRVVIKKK